MLRFLRSRSRVLVLDDDKSMQKLVATLLRREGYAVDVVDHGNDAIDALRTGDYRAVLLDLMMPHEGGMTVIGHLRETDPAMLERVILLTATPEPVLKGIAAEVAGVVRKPFEADELLSTVRRVVG